MSDNCKHNVPLDVPCRKCLDDLANAPARARALEQENYELKERVKKLEAGNSTVARLRRTRDALRLERNSLSAQLARIHSEFEPYFTSGNTIDVERAMIPKSVYDSLPKAAALDAEVLRCAEKYYSVMVTHSCDCMTEDYGCSEVRDLINAVREAKEAWE